MDVKERIQEYLDSKKIKINPFEASIGASNGYWRKTKSISANIVSDILRIYSDLNPIWVMTGVGDMIKVEKEKECIKQHVASPSCTYEKTESHTPLVQALINERRRYDENTAELLNQNRDLINQNRELTEIIRRQTELLGRPSTARTNIAGCADAG